MLMEKIASPADVKKMDTESLKALAAEIRTALLNKISKCGGHLGPNLGFVEPTIALHYVFESPKDKIVYDVSHQSYTHKILTGRAEAFLNPEKYWSVTGYTEPCESEHDQFMIGHTSTSVSLAELRATQGKSENNYFKSLGFDYLYVEQGNDIESLIAAFKQVKDSTKPVVVHIHTLKGKGYSFAENSKEGFHWAAPFDIPTGVVNWDSGESYGNILGEYLMKKIKADPKVVVIHSAVPAGIGFFADRRKEAGKQFIDVGIAEEHAVALASGLAKGGAKPIYSTHGTFIQRTYDQLSQDLCANNNPATILVTMSGADGMNDTTHLCIFDIPMMSNIPNLVYLCPTCVEEAIAMMDYAIEQTAHPMAIRIPNGVAHRTAAFDTDYSKLNTFKVDKRGSKVALIGLGSYYALAEEAAAELAKSGIDATIINPRFATGIDAETLTGLLADHQVVVTLENGVIDGGFGEKIARFYGNSDMRVLVKGLKKEFYDKVPYGELMERNRLTPKQIAEDVLAVLK